MTVKGNVIAKGTGQFQNAKIGNSKLTDYVHFVHKDKWNSETDYGFIHKKNGWLGQGDMVNNLKYLNVDGKLTVQGDGIFKSDLKVGNKKVARKGDTVSRFVHNSGRGIRYLDNFSTQTIQ